ncbi:hypothetical protein PIB30_073815 [Stylosanthes scabra]|uniref:Uncharacterized protein n=1 Tax=Stylosanthes scabra TaxID=79078 RepID=A0ABU6WSW0_9FABA|nr:hypothetical protein [Stylosanthes scabra]
MGEIASVLKDDREGQQSLLNEQRQQTSQVEPPKHCGICACPSHYTDECPQRQEDHTIAATHNFYDQPSSNTNNQAGLVTQNINNTPNSSQPSSLSALPSKPLPNPKGSINAISFHEDSLELKVTDDDEEEFHKMLEEISMKDDVGFEEGEGIIELGDGK